MSGVTHRGGSREVAPQLDKRTLRFPSPRLKLATQSGFYAAALANLVGLGRSDSASVAEAERRIASYAKARHAICTSMGRMAIYEGLRALMPRGGEVILSPITVPEVISMVLLAGSKPVFCDIEPGTWNLDPERVEALITPRTRAVMTTHFYGNMSATDPIQRICDDHGLAMIEDAAQAVGAWQAGRHAGTLGAFGILSFSYPKTVTCFYGGALLTDDDTLAETVRANLARYQPVDMGWLYRKIAECLIKDLATSRVGFPLSFLTIQYSAQRQIGWLQKQIEQDLNPKRLTALPSAYATRLSGFQARLLTRKWSDIDADVAHRVACAELYHDHLHDIEGLRVAPRVRDGSHTYLYYPVEVAEKLALQRFMIANGQDVAIQHTPNCAELAAYRAFQADCPLARQACRGTLMLPTYPGYSFEQVRQNTRVIRQFFDQPS